MPKQFDDDLAKLKERLLEMGATAERMIQDTVATLKDWDTDRFEQVPGLEDKMDQLQRDIDDETVRLISVYTPVAADLRFLLMSFRINVELERIADQAMNIGFYAKNMMREPPLKPLVDIPRMGEMAAEMLRTVLDAFTERSTSKALKVIKIDDRVDDLHDQVFRDLMTYIAQDPTSVGHVLELILTARAVERMADHAVNIAEDVIYMTEGEDIRHVGVEVLEQKDE